MLKQHDSHVAFLQSRGSLPCVHLWRRANSKKLAMIYGPESVLHSLQTSCWEQQGMRCWRTSCSVRGCDHTLRMHAVHFWWGPPGTQQLQNSSRSHQPAQMQHLGRIPQPQGYCKPCNSKDNGDSSIIATVKFYTAMYAPWEMVMW